MAKQLDLFGPPETPKKKGLDVWQNFKPNNKKHEIEAIFNTPPFAKQRAKKGMDQATASADRIAEQEAAAEEKELKLRWSLSVRDALEYYCRIHNPGHRFKCEDFWRWGEGEGHVETPHNRKAYGQIMSAAGRVSKKYGRQIIKWVSSDARSDNPNGHGHPIALWEVI